MEVEPYNEGPAYVFGNQTDIDQVAVTDFFKAIWFWIIGLFSDWGWPDISITQVDPLLIVIIVMIIVGFVVFKRM